MREDFEKDREPDAGDDKIISLRELGLILGNAAVEDRRGSTPEYVGHIIAILAGGLVEREVFSGEDVSDGMKPFMEALSNGSGGKIKVEIGDDLADVLERNPDAFDDGDHRKTKVISISVGDDHKTIEHISNDEISRIKAVNALIRSVGNGDNPEEHRGSKA